MLILQGLGYFAGAYISAFHKLCCIPRVLASNSGLINRKVKNPGIMKVNLGTVHYAITSLRNYAITSLRNYVITPIFLAKKSLQANRKFLKIVNLNVEAETFVSERKKI